MPTWTTKPDPSRDGHTYRIVRTPAHGTLNAVVTSTDLVGCYTHYHHHRTIPCEDSPDCPACKEGLPYRWHGYVSAVLIPTWEPVILEVTSAAGAALITCYEATGNLRGVQLAAHRPSGKPNGRVLMALKPTDPARIRLPEPPNVQQILCRIWSVPYNQPRQPYTPTDPPQ